MFAPLCPLKPENYEAYAKNVNGAIKKRNKMMRTLPGHLFRVDVAQQIGILEKGRAVRPPRDRLFSANPRAFSYERGRANEIFLDVHAQTKANHSPY